MASYHLSVKPVSRSQGRSATAAAAYRSGERIHCDREGREHDYTRRQGVVHCELMLPDDSPAWDRSQLWNAAEAAEKRGNSTVAREYELALPHELERSDQIALTQQFTGWLVERYGVAADIAIHEPLGEHDRRNVHAHILTTTRAVTAEGLGEKTRILDSQKTGPAEIEAIRGQWAVMQNQRLRECQVEARVDHRSLETQHQAHVAHTERLEASGKAVEASWARVVEDYYRRPPEVHLGPQAAAMERRAKSQAERKHEPYKPVTEVGRQTHEARSIRQEFGRSAWSWQQARDRAEEMAQQVKERLVSSLQAFGQALTRRDEQQRQREAEQRMEAERQRREMQERQEVVARAQEKARLEAERQREEAQRLKTEPERERQVYRPVQRPSWGQER